MDNLDLHLYFHYLSNNIQHTSWETLLNSHSWMKYAQQWTFEDVYPNCALSIEFLFIKLLYRAKIRDCKLILG